MYSLICYVAQITERILTMNFVSGEAAMKIPTTENINKKSDVWYAVTCSTLQIVDSIK